MTPRSTYRLQFHAGFRFTDAAALVPYLAALGISHVYASPYLRARAGSTHGYDIVDHESAQPRDRHAAKSTARSSPRCARTGWGTSSTSCPTTWASAATTTPGGSTC